MNKLFLNLLFLLLLISCKSKSQSNNWKLDSTSTLEGTTYRYNTKQSMARVLSLQELEKLAFRKIDNNGRDSYEQQLEFALSVLAIDVDKMKVDNNDVIPILSGSGYSADGEVKYAITYQEEEFKNIILVITFEEEFDIIKELNALKKNDLAFQKTQSNQKKNNTQPLRKESSQKKYPIPYGVKNKEGKIYWKGWIYKDDLHAKAGNESDPEAPKFAMEVIKVSQVKSKRAAIDRTLKMNNINSISYEKLEQMDISKQMLGNDMFFTIGKSKLAGKEAILFIRIEKVKNKTDYYVLVMEVPKKTYIEWGGISSILLATQVIKSMNSIPKERKQQIANATPKQQMKIYEAAYSSLMKQYYMGIMMTQSQALLRMQELNYDLILGGDITDPIIGN